MRLAPALRINGEIHKGVITDSHITLASGLGLPEPSEFQRGFTPDGKLFLNRSQALGFLMNHDRKAYDSLPTEAHKELHSHHLAATYGVKQKAATPDLSTKTVLVVDRGLHTYCAEKLAEKFKTVYFYLSEEDPYPNSSKASIGTGLKGVKRIGDMWDYVDKVDLICFFDTNYGDLAHYLRKHGYRVFGSGKGEELELDKIGFLEMLEKLGLPCPKTYVADGLEDALTYLKNNKRETLFLKCLHRGDFESKKFTSIPQITPFFGDLRKRLGTAADTVEILIQHKIDSECEAGIDGFCIDGKYTSNGIIGIEGKDTCFVGKVFSEYPSILRDINDAFSPEFKRLGYRGNFSTEVRIDKNGVGWFIDPTPRQPEPPGALMTEIYSNWAECLWDIAEGIVPTPEPVKEFGAQYILTSYVYAEHEMHVSIDDKYRKYLKLKNHKVVDGELFCTPNQNGEFFGSIVALGDSMDEAVANLKKIAETIQADGFHFDGNCFDEVIESSGKGRKFGINF